MKKQARELQVLLDEIGRRSVVVVTDRYPPDLHGGGEVSLHITMAASARKQELLVVTMAKILRPKRYTLDGVEVLALPRPANWPFQSQSQEGRELQKDFVENLFGERLAQTRAQRRSGVPAKLRRKALKVFQEDKPKGGTLADFADYPYGNLAVTGLRTVLEHLRPEMVHADNYRAIMVMAEATRGLDILRVGMVRDNRFHCVRHSQAAGIQGKECDNCKLACVEEDTAGSEQQERLRDHLSRVRDYRESSITGLDRVIVTSVYLEKAVEKMVPDAKIERITNAPEPLEKIEPLLVARDVTKGTPILVPGMLTENKGQIQMIEHLSKLIERVPDAVLHISGRGPRIARRLHERSTELGLRDRIILHDYVSRDELWGLFTQCQMVLLPTVWPEPFGRVPLEAALAMRPIVSFAVGGLSETILDGETGFLVEAGDYEGLFAGVAKLAGDPELRRTMGEAARKNVLKNHDAAYVASEFQRVWDDVRGLS